MMSSHPGELKALGSPAMQQEHQRAQLAKAELVAFQGRLEAAKYMVVTRALKEGLGTVTTTMHHCDASTAAWLKADPAVASVSDIMKGNFAILLKLGEKFELMCHAG